MTLDSKDLSNSDLYERRELLKWQIQLDLIIFFFVNIDANVLIYDKELFRSQT